jgi:hypothetical protein
MRNAAFLFLLGTFTVVAAGQSPVSVTGQISDSLCKAKHEEAAEGQGKMADRECTLACVRGGSKYVLLVGDKVMQITNQTFADLEKHAGHKVKVTGDVKGDQITVSKIEM